MRTWFAILAALAFCALGERAASAQSLNCAAVPQSICESEEVLALERDRAQLIGELAGLDPQHPALAGEQAWIDGLATCGEDALCYSAAYAIHNQSLRESVSALAGAQAEPPLEAPPDAIEDEPSGQSENAATSRRDRTRDGDGPTYAPAGLPGWGFFAAIGVTLFVFYTLLRAMKKNRRELRAEEARLLDELRRRW